MRTDRKSFRRATAFATAAAFFLTGAPLPARTQAAATTAAPESPIEIAHDPLACMTPIIAPEVDAGLQRRRAP